MSDSEEDGCLDYGFDAVDATGRPESDVIGPFMNVRVTRDDCLFLPGCMWHWYIVDFISHFTAHSPKGLFLVDGRDTNPALGVWLLGYYIGALEFDQRLVNI